jgi:hypothetical protein
MSKIFKTETTEITATTAQEAGDAIIDAGRSAGRAQYRITILSAALFFANKADQDDMELSGSDPDAIRSYLRRKGGIDAKSAEGRTIHNYVKRGFELFKLAYASNTDLVHYNDFSSVIEACRVAYKTFEADLRAKKLQEKVEEKQQAEAALEAAKAIGAEIEPETTLIKSGPTQADVDIAQDMLNFTMDATFLEMLDSLTPTQWQALELLKPLLQERNAETLAEAA